MIVLREQLDNEDRKLRNFLKKGYLSGEEEEEDGLIDVEQDDFLMDYSTRFGMRLKGMKDELTALQDLPRKKKQKQSKKIKDIQSNVTNLEEHEYFLDQLVKNKDLIDEDKLDSIRDDMDTFLIHPGNQYVREELKAEYQAMLEDISEELEEQRIEEQKQSIHQEEKKAETVPEPKPDQDRPKTRKELREERLRKEMEAKKETDLGNEFSLTV